MEQDRARPTDLLGRGIDDLRISVIDRCNLRCRFCMPPERTYEFLPRDELLSFEEIERLAQVFTSLGVRKIRLTGGEPLLRRELPSLIERLAQISGIEDLALTTNGHLLQKHAAELAAAGLDRVTVSIESLDDEIYGMMNGLGLSVRSALQGIDAAREAGLNPVKINMVVVRGANDHEIVPVARYFKERGCVVRFIEYMDVGTVNGWQAADVFSVDEILARLRREFEVEASERSQRQDVAERYSFADSGLELGIIASITRPFCGDCTRARLSSDGKLYTCLFSGQGTDLRELVRSGCSDDEIAERVRAVWTLRADRYSEQRKNLIPQASEHVEMFRIGG